MKITKEDRERISKLYSLNESWTDYGQQIDDVPNEPDATDLSDANRDEYIDKTFFDCLDTIHNNIGGRISKNDYIMLLDKYYENEPETSEEDLPF